MDVHFKTPANSYICRQSQCRKSYLVRSMLNNLDELFYPVPSRTVYCHGEYQPLFDDMLQTIPNISFVQGIPEDLYDMTCPNSLVAIDNLMSQCSNEERMSDMFTKGSHHKRASVMYLMQNLFPPGKQLRTISLNSHYVFVFKNSRNALGISTLACQMYPNNTKFLPYGYLLMDLHQLTPENMQVRTNILPGEKQMVYVKRS